MIWAKEETLPRVEIESIQLKRLKEAVHYIYDRVEPYRRKMDEAGIKPDDIQSLDDLKKMPFTYKADFRDNYPMGLFAVDKKELVRFHASSGTTGKPTVVGYTRKDLDVWLNNVARIACMGGATPHDADRIRLWNLYRGAGTAWRLGETGGIRNPNVIRQYQEADHVHAGYRHDASGRNPFLCAASGRGDTGQGPGPVKRSEGAYWTVRRRRHDGTHAGRDA